MTLVEPPASEPVAAPAHERAHSAHPRAQGPDARRAALPVDRAGADHHRRLPGPRGRQRSAQARPVPRRGDAPPRHPHRSRRAHRRQPDDRRPRAAWSSRRPGSAGSTASSTPFPTRPQDKFNVHPEDAATFRERILPYWQGKTLEDSPARARMARSSTPSPASSRSTRRTTPRATSAPTRPSGSGWGRPVSARRRPPRLASAAPDQREFYESVLVVLDAAMDFMRRYADLATRHGAAAETPERAANLREIARICSKLAAGGAETFREAVQSLWFLFTLLHMESNASSFSPGRADQYLYPYYHADIDAGRLDRAGALELVEALWLKFNQIVYLRNSHSASFFAGFPIGFNVAFGGRDEAGRDESNELSYLFLEAQSHILLPQPNLSARLHEGTPGRAPRRVHAGDRPRLRDAAGVQRRVASSPPWRRRASRRPTPSTTRSSAASSSPPTATTSGGATRRCSTSSRRSSSR